MKRGFDKIKITNTHFSVDKAKKVFLRSAIIPELIDRLASEFINLKLIIRIPVV